jgi:hypothetical protein
MPTTIRNTDILFNDGTTQSTAATGASTAFGAVGTYAVLMMAANTNLAIDGTIAGSSLRYNDSPNGITNNASTAGITPFMGMYTRSSVSTYLGGGTSVSGTWRKVSSGTVYTSYSDCGTTYYIWSRALYVRVS